MKQLITKYLLIFSAFYLLTSFSPQRFHTSDDWKLKKYENGIAVYNRHEENSAFKELKAVTQIKTSLSSVVALLKDWDTYPQWVYRCGVSSTLKKMSETELIHYQTVDAPWPVDSRDFVVKIKITQDPETKTIKQTATCMAEFIPKQKGYIRITEFKAAWTLTPLKNGVVNVEYQLLVNPGGVVPAWIVNMAAIDGPYETTLNLKKWVMKEKYQKAKFDFIEEPTEP